MTAAEIAAWEVQYRNAPVWRDGLSTTLTYLIVAVHKTATEYNCVCVRKLGPGQHNVKFYPGVGAWSLTPTELNDLGAYCPRDRTYESNAGYYRVRMGDIALEKLLERLAITRNVTAVAKAKADEALYSGEGKNDSVRLHPVRGGGRPALPYVAPVLLADLS